MIAKYGKRALSFFLAMMMVLSVMPVQAFAEEAHDHQDENVVVTSEQNEVTAEESEETSEEEPEEEPGEETTEPGESEAMIALRAEVAAYVETYGLSADMPDSVLIDVYFALDGEQAQAAWFGVEDFMAQGMELPLEERKVLLDEQNTKLVKRFYEVMERINSPMLLADSTFYPVEGISVMVSGTTEKAEESNGTITVTMKGTSSCGVDGYNSADITITNTSDKKSVITFSWENNNCVDADTVLYDNPFSVELDVGATLVVGLQSPNGSSNTGTFSLSGFAVEAMQGSEDVTFEYDATRGTVTHNGETVENGAVVSVAYAGATLQATATGNNRFLAWVDDNNVILSREATYGTFDPGKATVVKAIFAETEPTFMVDDTYMIMGLNEAVAKGSRVVLMNEAILPAGDYTIPSGVTLLIPHDAANTLKTTTPAMSETYTTPTAYRTLKMASGASITVDGALIVSGVESGQTMYNGQPTGPVGFIRMDSGSNITINSGAFLYVWGYITGSGNVTVKNSGTVYENFQLTDWRGGSATSSMAQDETHRVLPMSSYYVQNVEVPMRLEAGAIENGHMSVVITFAGQQGANVPFIGPNGMFQIQTGYIIKDYIESEDRLKFDIYGDVGMQPLSISMKLTVIGSTTINSKNFNMPINGNITVNVVSGNINVTQDLALLPGAKMIIGEGTNCTLAEGGKIFVYDQDDWGGYLQQYNYKIMALNYAPGRTCAARGESSLVDAEVIINGSVDGSLGSMYTTTGGANVHSTGSGRVKMRATANAVTYQATQNDTNISYVEIPVTSAKLKNADGSYTTTSNTAATFVYDNGTWRQECDGTNHVLGDSEDRKDPTCQEAGYLKGTCVDCGAVVDEVLEKLAHTEVVDAAVPATCTEDGLTEGKHCSACNEVIVAQTVEEKLGHDWSSYEVSVQVTCTTDGEEVRTCYREGCGQQEKNVIPSRNHDQGFNTVTVPPTCTEEGYDLTTCKYGDCDYSEKTNIVVAKGHNWGPLSFARSEDNTTWTASRTCKTDESHVDSETVQTVITTVEATCVQQGSVTYEAFFDAEWAPDQRDFKAGEYDFNNHKNTEVLEAKAPTCIEDGLKEGLYCNDCKTVVVEQETEPKLNHAYGEPVYSEWSVDYLTFTATRTCAHDAAHVEVATAKVTPSVAQEATCVQIGKITYTAEFTEEWAETKSITVDDEINPDNHKNTTEVGAKDPTCTEPGYGAGLYCNDCEKMVEGGEQNEAPLSHRYEAEGSVVVTAPTCTEDGYTTMTCDRGCGHTEVVDIVTASGHKNAEPVKENEVPASCMTDGSYDSVVYCSVCKEEQSREAVSVEHPGHTVVVDEAVAPKCEETGLTQGSHCFVCEEVLEEQQVIPATEHRDTTVVDPAVEATCTQTGLSVGSHCTACNAVLVPQEEIPVKSHSYEEKITKEPTCEGVGEKTYTCSACGDTYTEEIKAKGHDYSDKRSSQDPTCTEVGWSEYYVCPVCEEILNRVEYPAMGHDEKAPVVENNVPATCTEDGHYDNVVYCSECNAEVSRETITVDALDHTPGETVVENNVPASCTEGGSYENVVYCSACEAELSREKITVDPLDHEAAEAVEENHQAPTCTEKGSYDSVVYCAVCNAELSRETVEIPAKNHTEEEIPAVESTCTATGLTAGIKCSECGEIITAQTEVPAKGHSNGEAVSENKVEATCTEDGSYDSVIYCTVEGCKAQVSRETIVVPATNHKDTTVIDEAVAPKCEETGLTQGSHCTACGAVLEKQEIVRATGHSYKDGKCEQCGEAQPGITVSGAVTSFNSDTDEVTIELFAEGEETPAYTATVAGNDAQYSISNVLEGTYTMKVSKKNHVTREYQVEVGTEAVAQDVKICLIGDISGDGIVNAMDNGRLLRHIKETQMLTGYELAVADINGDGVVNAMDDGLMLRHIKETKLLW